MGVIVRRRQVWSIVDMVTRYTVIISGGGSNGMIVNKRRRKLLHIEGSRGRRLRRGRVFAGC